MPSGVTIDGKFFRLGGDRFPMRGVSYGTFRPRHDGTRYPEWGRLSSDFRQIRECGFNVVRTYTFPSDDVLELAVANDLRLLAATFWPDWRYLVGASRRQTRRVVRDAAATVRTDARRLAGNEHVMALVLGNEVPADVVRFVGTDTVADAVQELLDVVHEADPERLVTYANYPTTEYLPLEGCDFLTFNVFLERRPDLRRYLTRLHHLAGDRPLVLGEVGLDATPRDGETRAAGERRQAVGLDWMLETAIERGVAGTCTFSWTDEWWVGEAAVDGWRFGLTDADRNPRPALGVATTWNHRDVRDLPFNWPSVSVVICAYNAAPWLDQCLRHAVAMDYRDYEIIVVDDGSDDETAEIAGRYHGVRLFQTGRQGLSAARNVGHRIARGDVIAYLDSDAYPTPEWLWYLVLGFDGRAVGGTGGPNVPPPEAGPGEQRVARAPGGPVHVLLSDDRAEHVPGCNMAFWSKVLDEVGGFDPIYRAAGDDVDVCWKVLDRGWEIGFHPAASVWHHRRTGVRPYLRQQCGYGRAEGLVEARHPNRFTAVGTARWRGRIYDSLAGRATRQRIYRGVYGTAPFQPAYERVDHRLDLAHQVGVPAAAAAIATLPAGLVTPALAIPGLLAAAALTVLFLIDLARAHPPRRFTCNPWRFRVGVACMHLLQPLWRGWGRASARRGARQSAATPVSLPPLVRRAARGVLVFPEDRPREAFAAAIVAHLHGQGVRVVTGSGWDDYDARIIASTFVVGDVVTSRYPEGCIQLRVRRRLRLLPSSIVAGALGAAWFLHPHLAATAIVLTSWALASGLWRTGPALRRGFRTVQQAAERARAESSTSERRRRPPSPPQRSDATAASSTDDAEHSFAAATTTTTTTTTTIVRSDR